MRVSVIIPTYNRYKLLIRAIQSVQNQTFTDIEIIIVNDCSTQQEYYSGELEKMEKVKVIHLQQNQRKVFNISAAQGKTRQYGLNSASGDWIAFLDDDDYWVSTKIEEQLQELEQTDCKMCSTNMFVFNDNEILGIYFPVSNIPKLMTLDYIRKDNKINNSTVIIHKEICNLVGEFRLGSLEDYDYWLRALKYTNCLYLHKPLVYYSMNNIKYYESTPADYEKIENLKQQI